MKTRTAKNSAPLDIKSRAKQLRSNILEGSLGIVLDKLSLSFEIDVAEIEGLCDRFQAVALYGSCARGDAKENSDIDLLVVDELQNEVVEVPGRFSVTNYTPAHLGDMAHRGSLFVLHLREEAKILVDRSGIISSLVNEWIEPDYSRLREGMNAAAAVLDEASSSGPTPTLRRVSLFVLRSVLRGPSKQSG